MLYNTEFILEVMSREWLGEEKIKSSLCLALHLAVLPHPMCGVGKMKVLLLSKI